MNWELPIDSDACRHLVVTLAHFLWQGVAIGLLATGVSACLRDRTAHSRYVIHAFALLAMLICLPVTFTVVSRPEQNAAGIAVRSEGATLVRHGSTADEQSPVDVAAHAAAPTHSETATATESIHPFETGTPGGPSVDASDAMSARPVTSDTDVASDVDDRQWASVWSWAAPCVTAAYLAGVVVMFLRLLLAVWGGQRLRRGAAPVTDPELLVAIQAAAHKLKLKSAPAVAFCRRVAVPVVIGFVRPVVLLPMSLTTGLTPDQFRAIVTHELAHIRRFDHVVLMFQRVAEAILFFHPIVWYISRQLSNERENSCDDIVLGTGGERFAYAESLVRVAELRLLATGHAAIPNAVALAATGNPCQLRRRIARLIGMPVEPAIRLTRGGILALLLIAASVLVTPLVVRSWAQNQGEKASQANPDASIVIDVGVNGGGEGVPDVFFRKLPASKVNEYEIWKRRQAEQDQQPASRLLVDLQSYGGFSRFVLPDEVPPDGTFPVNTRAIEPLVEHLDPNTRQTQEKAFSELQKLWDVGTPQGFKSSAYRIIDESSRLHPVYRAALMFNVIMTAHQHETWAGHELCARLREDAAMAALASADDVPLGLVLRMLEFSSFYRVQLDNTKDERWPHVRREKTRLWLISLKKLREIVDPKWDPADAPQRNISNGGGVFIPDPRARAEYEALMEANRRKAEQYLLQSTTRKLLTDLTPQMEQFLVKFYVIAPLDVAELNMLMEEFSADPQSRARITRTVQAVNAVLPNGQPYSRFGLQAAFRDAGVECVPTLLDLVGNKDYLYFARQEALFGLGMVAADNAIGDTRAAETLRAIANDESEVQKLRDLARAYLPLLKTETKTVDGERAGRNPEEEKTEAKAQDRTASLTVQLSSPSQETRDKAARESERRRDRDQPASPAAETQVMNVLDAGGRPATFNTVVNARVGFPGLARDWAAWPKRDGSVSLAGLPPGAHWLVITPWYRDVFMVELPLAEPATRRFRTYTSLRSTNFFFKTSVRSDEDAGDIIRVEIENGTDEEFRFSELDVHLEAGVWMHSTAGVLSPRWVTGKPELVAETTIAPGEKGHLEIKWREWARGGLWFSTMYDMKASPALPDPEPGKMFVRVHVRTHGTLPVPVTHPMNEMSAALQGTWRLIGTESRTRGKDSEKLTYDAAVSQKPHMQMTINRQMIAGAPVGPLEPPFRIPASGIDMLSEPMVRGMYTLDNTVSPKTLAVELCRTTGTLVETQRRAYIYRFDAAPAKAAGKILELAFNPDSPANPPASWDGGPLVSARFLQQDQGDEQAGDKEDGRPEWGEPLLGLRMRLSAPRGNEYRRGTRLPLLVEMQNVSEEPIRFADLHPNCNVKVETETGQWLGIARIDATISPWEGSSGSLAPQQTLQWNIWLDALRLNKPIAAGANVQVRVSVPRQIEEPDKLPRTAYSLPVVVKCLDATHVVLKAGDSPKLPAEDVGEKWSEDMDLVYREVGGIFGKSRAIHIDGQGNVTMVDCGNPGRTEVKLDRDRLDKLAARLRQIKIWELSDVKWRMPNPDEGEVRILLRYGGTTVVGDYANGLVRENPTLLKLRDEMLTVIDEAVLAYTLKQASHPA